MSIETRTPMRVIDLPYKPLLPDDHNAVEPLAKQVCNKALNLLGEDGETLHTLGSPADFPIRKLHIGRPYALPGRIYDGANVVAEIVWVDMTGTVVNRECSFAFYDSVVINRQNTQIILEGNRSKTLPKGQIENHEASEIELKNLEEQMDIVFLE